MPEWKTHLYRNEHEHPQYVVAYCNHAINTVNGKVTKFLMDVTCQRCLRAAQKLLDRKRKETK